MQQKPREQGKKQFIEKLVKEDAFRKQTARIWDKHNRALSQLDVLSRCRRLNQFLNEDLLADDGETEGPPTGGRGCTKAKTAGSRGRSKTNGHQPHAEKFSISAKESAALLELLDQVAVAVPEMSRDNRPAGHLDRPDECCPTNQCAALAQDDHTQSSSRAEDSSTHAADASSRSSADNPSILEAIRHAELADADSVASAATSETPSNHASEAAATCTSSAAVIITGSSPGPDAAAVSSAGGAGGGAVRESTSSQSNTQNTDRGSSSRPPTAGTDEMLDVIFLLNSKSPITLLQDHSQADPSPDGGSSNGNVHGHGGSSADCKRSLGDPQQHNAAICIQKYIRGHLARLAAKKRAMGKSLTTLVQQQQPLQQKQAIEANQQQQQQSQQLLHGLDAKSLETSSDVPPAGQARPLGPGHCSVSEMQKAAWTGYYSYWHVAAVILVQRRWKTRRARRAFLRQRQAAVALQSAWRGWLVRTDPSNPVQRAARQKEDRYQQALLQAQQRAQRNAAALVLQRCVRAHQAQAALQQLKTPQREAKEVIITQPQQDAQEETQQQQQQQQQQQEEEQEGWGQQRHSEQHQIESGLQTGSMTCIGQVDRMHHHKHVGKAHMALQHQPAASKAVIAPVAKQGLAAANYQPVGSTISAARNWTSGSGTGGDGTRRSTRGNTSGDTGASTGGSSDTFSCRSINDLHMPAQCGSSRTAARGALADDVDGHHFTERSSQQGQAASCPPAQEVQAPAATKGSQRPGGRRGSPPAHDLGPSAEAAAPEALGELVIRSTADLRTAGQYAARSSSAGSGAGPGERGGDMGARAYRPVAAAWQRVEEVEGKEGTQRAEMSLRAVLAGSSHREIKQVMEVVKQRTSTGG